MSSEKQICISVYKYLGSFRKASKCTNIPKTTIWRWYNSVNSTRIDIFSKNKKIQCITPIIKSLLEKNNFLTVKDITDILSKQYKLKCSYGLIRSIIKIHLNLSYKKIKYSNYTNITKLKDQTNYFIERFKNQYVNNLIISIDEVGFNTRFNPIYGWSLKGQKIRCLYKLDTGKNFKNKSVCCCITSQGELIYEIKNCAYNNILFLDFLKKLNYPENTIILLDNVRFHHSINIKEYINLRGWIPFYTPPYSPWFNPIENVFSMVKHNYRKTHNILNSFNIVTKEIIEKIVNRTVDNIKNNLYILN